MSVATYQAGAQRRARRFGVAITIEGLGDATAGLWYLCDHRPAWASTSAWKQVLAKPRPSIMPERVSPFGGMPEAGDLEARLVDVRDLLTGELGLERDADAFLAAAVSASSAAVLLDRAVAVGDRLYAAAETMLVTADLGSNRYSVTRGALGTEAQTHELGDAVRLYLGTIKSRRARLYVYPLDGADSTTLREVGTYYVDGLPLDDTFNVWTIRGRSQLKHLGRVVARVAERGVFAGEQPAQNVSAFAFAGLTGPRFLWDAGPLTDEEVFTFLVDDELVGITPRTPDGATFVAGTPMRGLLGTAPSAHAPGAPAVRVYCAGRELRWSPGPSPSSSRTSGTWQRALNFVDLILVVLTSSAADEDGLELVNVLTSGRDDTLANWSSLPPGVGVGMPISLIDVEAALDLKQRLLDVELEHLFLGDESTSFGEWVTEKVLRPLGGYLVTAAGRARIKVPRVPLVGAADFEIGPSSVLRKRVGRRRYMPRLTVDLDTATIAGAIRATGMRTGDGVPVERVFSDDDFAKSYGQRGFYGAAEGAVEYDASAVRASAGGDVPFLARAAASSLFRLRRPPQRVTADLDDAELYEMTTGDIAALTFPEVPDYAARARGVTAMPLEVLTVEPILDDDKDGLYLHVEALGYMVGVRVGRVSASGLMDGASVEVSGDSVCTLAANVYTAPDAGNELPVTDAAAFAVDDVVQVIDTAGVAVGATRVVVAVDGPGNKITLEGATSVADGALIIYAGHADQATQQREGFVSFGDRASGVIAGSEQVLWHFGEP